MKCQRQMMEKTLLEALLVAGVQKGWIGIRADQSRFLLRSHSGWLHVRFQNHFNHLGKKLFEFLCLLHHSPCDSCFACGTVKNPCENIFACRNIVREAVVDDLSGLRIGSRYLGIPQNLGTMVKPA